MSDTALVVEATLLDDRYHGRPEWPPSPARLFQALVAASANGARLDEKVAQSLDWLEALAPPVIAAPRQREGAEVNSWVPNNDLDSALGDESKVAKIRTGKVVKPRLLEGHSTFLYAWSIDEKCDECNTIQEACRRLYQLGRGIDMAYASADLYSQAELEERLASFDGEVLEPNGGDPGQRSVNLLTPTRGTLASLKRRHEATLTRFEPVQRGRSSGFVFSQPSKARTLNVRYGGKGHSALFELRSTATTADFSPWPATRVVALIEAIKEQTAKKLLDSATAYRNPIERYLLGKGTGPRVPATQRIQLLALPSIGHPHVDRNIRRVLVRADAGCPIPFDDLLWALSGLEVSTGTVLSRPTEQNFLGHYGNGTLTTTWATETPAALGTQRRRIDPARIDEVRKPASERLRVEADAKADVFHALRMAGIRPPLAEVEVQREPFHARGFRAEWFAGSSRFKKEQLWHVRLRLQSGVQGPLAFGDGRFLGLGLLAPLDAPERCFAFAIVSGLDASTTADVVVRSLRRAVMSRCQQEWGNQALPSPITGHRRDGTPEKERRHLIFACDLRTKELHVIAPSDLPMVITDKLARALANFRTLLCGAGGVLELNPTRSNLTSTSRAWQTVTPYQVLRHRDLGSTELAIQADLKRTLRLNALPDPSSISVEALHDKGPLRAHIRLVFNKIVPGPISLGKGIHQGYGLFAPVSY